MSTTPENEETSEVSRGPSGSNPERGGTSHTTTAQGVEREGRAQWLYLPSMRNQAHSRTDGR